MLLLNSIDYYCNLLLKFIGGNLMKTLKKSLALLLAVLMVVFSVPFEASDADLHNVEFCFFVFVVCFTISNL